MKIEIITGRDNSLVAEYFSSSSTPETDAAKWHAKIAGDPLGAEVAYASKAEQLERERNEAREWKESVLEILQKCDLQTIGQLLGLSLGGCLLSNLEPILHSIREELENKREIGTRLELVYKQLDTAQEDIKKLQDQITEWENKWRCAVEMAAKTEEKHISLLQEFKQIRKERNEAFALITSSLAALPVGYLPAHTPESIPERIGDLCSEIVHLEKENEEISERFQQEKEEARKLASHWRNKTSSKTKDPLPWENL